MTDHYLLMTATPHKGDPENFCLFLELLDRDVYGDVKSFEEAMRRKTLRSISAAPRKPSFRFPTQKPAKSRSCSRSGVHTAFFDLDATNTIFTTR